MEKKRPLIITLVSVYYAFTLAVAWILLFIVPTNRIDGPFGQGASVYAAIFILFQTIAIVGYWNLKKWSVYLFFTLFLMSFFISKYVYITPWRQSHSIYFAVIIITGLIYFWEIKIRLPVRSKVTRKKELDTLSASTAASGKKISYPVLFIAVIFILSCIGFYFYASGIKKGRTKSKIRNETDTKSSLIRMDNYKIIHLKNGNILEGIVKSKTEDGIFLEVLGGRGEFFLSNEEIEGISEPAVRD